MLPTPRNLRVPACARLTPSVATSPRARALGAGAACLALSLALTPLAGCASAESPGVGVADSGTSAPATAVETPESQFAAAAKSLDGFLAEPNKSRGATPAARPRANAPTNPPISAPSPTLTRVDPSRPTTRTVTPQPVAAMTEPVTPPAITEADQPVESNVITDQPATMAPDSATLAPAPAITIAPSTPPAQPARAPAPAETPLQRRERLITELAALAPTNLATSRPLTDSLRALLWRSSIQSDPASSIAAAARAFANQAMTLRASLDTADARAIDATDRLLRDLATASDHERIKAAIAEAHAALSSSESLTLPAAQLCTRIESYGRFTPIETTILPAGKPLVALLYTEVDGFTNATIDAPGMDASGTRFTIHLSQELALYSEMGTVVWSTPRQSLKEESRNRRRDFFTTQRVDLPASLAPGKYTLKLTLRDELKNAVAERTIDLTFVAGAIPRR